MKSVVVGTLESSDCMITLKPHDTLKIEIDSPVAAVFGAQIRAAIKAALKKEHLTNVHVLCQDKGALDYAIEARVRAAAARFKEVRDAS